MYLYENRRAVSNARPIYHANAVLFGVGKGRLGDFRFYSEPASTVHRRVTYLSPTVNILAGCATAARTDVNVNCEVIGEAGTLERDGFAVADLVIAVYFQRRGYKDRLGVRREPFPFDSYRITIVLVGRQVGQREVVYADAPDRYVLGAIHGLVTRYGPFPTAAASYDQFMVTVIRLAIINIFRIKTPWGGYSDVGSFNSGWDPNGFVQDNGNIAYRSAVPGELKQQIKRSPGLSFSTCIDAVESAVVLCPSNTRAVQQQHHY